MVAVVPEPARTARPHGGGTPRDEPGRRPSPARVGRRRRHLGPLPTATTAPVRVPSQPPRRAATRRPHRGAVLGGLLLLDVCALLAVPALVGGLSLPAVAYAAVAVVLLAVRGTYRPRIRLSAMDQAPQLTARLGMALLVVGPLTGVEPELGLHALASAPVLVAGRGVGYARIRRARRRGSVEPALVIGGGRVGQQLLDAMGEHPEYGLTPVGFLGDRTQTDRCRPLGRTSDLDEVVERCGVRTVVVAFGAARDLDLIGVLRTAAQRDLDVYVVPRFFDVGMAPHDRRADDLWGIPLLRVQPSASRRCAWRAKRVIDVAVAGTGLVVLAPLFLVLALAVRLSSPGPIFFRQARTGRSGQRISVLKFRSLRVAEPAGSSPSGAPTIGVDDAMRARQHDVDRRQTPVGDLLRRTSLDELPQLWNVLKGDMSLVGPRPEECTYADRFAGTVHGYRDRHRLAVGLTGWAQVHDLRGDTSIEARARFDNHYIEHWSPWLECQILLRTLTAVARQTLRTSGTGPAG